MIIEKVTHGYVRQLYNTETKKWEYQDFTAGDEPVEFWITQQETARSIEIDRPDEFNGPDEPYFPFTMVQPDQ